MLVLGLKNCDTCRKALSEMRASGLDPDFRDLREGEIAPLVDEVLDKVPLELLVNKRSTTWRGLDEPTRARALSKETAAEVLGAHPTLMKRPIIFAENRVHIGWSAETRAAVL